MSFLDAICQVIEVAGPAFSRGFVEAVADLPQNRISYGERPEPQTRIRTRTRNAGTPVSDSLEELAETMWNCAQSIRPQEPLEIPVMRDYGRAVMLANGEAVRVMGELMGRLGK